MSLYVNIEKHLPSFDLKVNFEHKSGVLGFLGASGSGKSMSLKCISGLVTPSKGKIIVNDKIFFDSEKSISLSPQKRKIGYLFQNYALFPNMNIIDNIEIGTSRSLASTLAVSSGKPCIEPGDVEQEDVLARRDLARAVGRCGGSIISTKKSLLLALPQEHAGLHLVAGQPVAQHVVLVAAARLLQPHVGAGSWTGS